jgi:ABC transporter substrate binding protein (PQQ-dependent alcohol dehydrogenase system)
MPSSSLIECGLLQTMSKPVTYKRIHVAIVALWTLSTLLLLMKTAHAANWNVVLIEQANNPQLEKNRVERAYMGHPAGAANDAITMALDEEQFALEATKTTITIKAEQVSSLEMAKMTAQKAEKAGSPLLVINLPGAWTSAVAASVKLPILNIGASEDNLREGDCLANMYHLLPSERMRTDALAQALMARKWSQVLLLVGAMPEDIKRSQTAQASMKRYGLKIVAIKSFKLSADPRERSLANLQLLTANNTYDAVWVVDSDGEFARSLPYNTAQARPVVGDAGMVALAWDTHFERFGAPQVMRRFTKIAKRAMTDFDWAAWMAGKAVVAAAAAPSADVTSIVKALSSASLDGSKGIPLQFRSWDRQLKQSMLLTDGQGVVATMPMEGILHPKNILDTLGADEGEKLCKFKS